MRENSRIESEAIAKEASATSLLDMSLQVCIRNINSDEVKQRIILFKMLGGTFIRECAAADFKKSEEGGALDEIYMLFEDR